MGKLIYSAIASLDGYIEGADGKFDWAVPNEEVHAFINDLERSAGTYLYGRRMYEVMEGWETDPSLADRSPLMRDFAQIWTAADKIVYSTTLETAPTARTRIERVFDPEAVRRMKTSTPTDLTVGGPNLAAHAFKAGLVDECRLFITPIVVGGGKGWLPENVWMELELLDEHAFGNGTVYLRYRTRLTHAGEHMTAAKDVLDALDEVVDAIMEVKQAEWLAASQAALHAELSALMEYLVALKDEIAQDERALGGDPRELRAPSSRPRPRLPSGPALAQRLCADVRGLADHIDGHAAGVQGAMLDSLRSAAAELRRRADSVAASLT